MIAKSLGEGEKNMARIYASLCFWGALLMGIIIGIMIILFREPLLGILGATSDTRAFARTYMIICAAGVPFMLVSTTLASIIRSEGVILEGVIGNMTATVINIILDPIFILVFKMGVAGAALATVLGNLTGCIYFFIYVKRKAQILNMNPTLAAAKADGTVSYYYIGNAECPWKSSEWSCIDIFESTACALWNECGCGDGSSRKDNDDYCHDPDGNLYGCAAVTCI